MIRTLKNIKFNIVNPRIVHSPNQIKVDRHLPFNITEECADQMYRFFSSFHHDHSVENVWVQNKGPAFSGGADYEELLNSQVYLDKIFRLSLMLGQFNKPVFAKINGSVRGISAYIINMFSTPLATQKSSLRLDQTSRGFIPVCGGSHLLSRMTGNLGIYLALTGQKLDSQQMMKTQFLRGRINDQYTNKQVRKALSDANLFMRNPYTPSSFSSSQNKRQIKLHFKMNYFENMIEQTQKQIFKSDGNFNSKLALNQYRIAQTNYNNTINPYNSLSTKDVTVHNYFQMRHDRPFQFLKQKQILQDAKTDDNTLNRIPTYKLMNVFQKKNMYQVIKALQNDNSQWSVKTLQSIRNKDPLSVHLTFHLIKNSYNLSWVQALQQQYKVARRLLRISKVKQVDISGGRSLKILHNQYSNMKIQDIPSQVISSFFAPAQDQSLIFDHDTPNNSLMPTANYWRKVPDAGRNYLNRTFFQDIHSKFGQIQVRRFLNEYKIDYRDKSFNIPVLREYLHDHFDFEKKIQIEKKRIRAIISSDVFYKNLKNQRLSYAQQIIKSNQFSKIIAKQIQSHFQNQFNKRFQELQKTAKINGKQQRMNIVKNYVKTLVNNIVLNGDKIQQRRRTTNVRHNGIVRFDKSGKDIFEAQTQHQKSISQLNLLKQAYKTGDVSKLQILQEQQILNEFPYTAHKLSDSQHQLIKQDALLRLNYDRSIIARQKAAKLKFLIQKAAKTSQQISGLLGWGDQDIQTLIINAPKSEKSFKQFANKVMDKGQDNQAYIENANRMFEIFQNGINQLNNKSQQKSSKVDNMIFDINTIPKQFKQAHLTLLRQVISFFAQKYKINGLLSSNHKNKNSSIISEWGQQTLSQGFSKLIKNDVEYTFSFLVVLHLKDILIQIRKNKSNNIESISKLLSQKYNINIQGMDQKKFNNFFMSYFYKMLDMHQDNKHRIIFPQTKMIQFLNKLKMQGQMRDDFGHFSFNSLALLIARDRKRIRDNQNGIVPLLGYQPQTALNQITIQQKIHNKGMPNLGQYFYDDEHDQNSLIDDPFVKNKLLIRNKLQKYKQQNKLVSGFPGYLRRFQGILQKVAGSTMFLPKYLYDTQNKRQYQILKSLINVQMTKQQWFMDKLRSAISNIFQFRLSCQKKMNQGQLKTFDQDFAEFFSPQLLPLVIRFQIQKQQSTARLHAALQNNDKSTNQKIKSQYLQMKKQIKNPRALRMLNNLLMSHNVINDRLDQVRNGDYKRNYRTQIDIVTQQQRNDIEGRRDKQISRRTIDRLAHQAMVLADDHDQGCIKIR